MTERLRIYRFYREGRKEKDRQTKKKKRERQTDKEKEKRKTDRQRCDFKAYSCTKWFQMKRAVTMLELMWDSKSSTILKILAALFFSVQTS